METTTAPTKALDLERRLLETSSTLQEGIDAKAEIAQNPNDFFLGDPNSLMLYPSTRRVYVNDENGLREVKLARVEYRLLQYLMIYSSHPRSFEQIFKDLYGYHMESKIISDDGIKQNIVRLRRKIGQNFIQYVINEGYMCPIHNSNNQTSVEDPFKNLLSEDRLNILDKGGERIFFTESHHIILKALIENRGETVTKDHLIGLLRPGEVILDSDYHRLVKTYIYRLRPKTEAAIPPIYIDHVYGVGYTIGNDIIPIIEQAKALKAS